jgi:carboxylesterase
MLHGFSASPYECADLATRLFRMGWNVLVPRIAGHGTTRQDFDSKGLKDWMASAQRAYEAAKGLGRNLVVVGQSGGGVLATLLCAPHQAEIAALVLATPAYRLASPAAPFSRFRLVRWLIPEVRIKPAYPDVEAHWNTVYGTQPVSELVRGGSLAARQARSLRLPVAMLQASRDPIVSASFNLKVFAKIPSRDKELFFYDSTEHNVLHRHNVKQKEVLAWIGDFLKTRT